MYNEKGFTLIEVMIVVVIIGILSAIAYPSYTEYVMRANRSEGQAYLIDVAARQERFYSQNNSYVNKESDVGKLGLSGNKSPTGKYTLSISVHVGDGGYTLTAANGFGDDACGNLTLNGVGVKSRTGSGKSEAECWR